MDGSPQEQEDQKPLAWHSQGREFLVSFKITAATVYWALPVPQAGAEHARATSPFILTTVLLDQFSYYFHSVDEKTEFKSFSINSVKVLPFK